MANAQVYSADLTAIKTCTLTEANRLLGLGKARILKYFPFSVQMKSADPDTFIELDNLPVQPPASPLTQSKKHRKVEVENEVAYIF